MFKKLFIGLIILLGLCLCVWLILPQLIPATVYKQKIQTQLSQQLGRQVRIKGDVKLALFPTIRAKLDHTYIDNHADFSSPHLAVIESLEARIKLWPLLTRHIEIEHFLLKRPQIFLEKNSQGQTNWMIAPQVQTPPPAFKRNGQLTSFEAHIGTLSLQDGEIHYQDMIAQREYSLTQTQLDVTLQSLAKPFKLDGYLLLNGAPAQLDLTLTTLQAFFNGKKTTIDGSIALDFAEIKGRGHFAESHDMIYDIDMQSYIHDLGKFADIFGFNLPEHSRDNPIFKQFSIQGQLSGRPGQLTFKQAEVGFDKFTGTGKINLDLSHTRPHIRGQLNMGHLDFSPYMGEKAAASDKNQKKRELAPWSEDPLNFSMLQNFNANLDFTADMITMGAFRLNQSAINLSLKDGYLNIKMPELKLYSGQGTVNLSINSNPTLPKIKFTTHLNSLDSQSFLNDLIKRANISAEGGINLEFTTQGRSQNALMKALTGHGDIGLAQGEIEGFDLTLLLKEAQNILTTKKLLKGIGKDYHTEFNDLKTNFQITNGVLKLSTFTFKGPGFRTVGNGTIDIGTQQLDMRIHPKLTTQGQNDLAATGLPLRIHGPFNNISTGLDTQAVTKLLARKIIKAPLGNTSEILDGILDAGSNDNDEDSVPNSILNLFGKKKK